MLAPALPVDRTAPRNTAVTRRVASRRCLLSLALALAACDRAAVSWQTDMPFANVPTSAGGSVLQLPHGGAPTLALPSQPPTIPPLAAPCPGSLVMAAARPHEWFAVWWASRPTASVALVASRTRDDGGRWSEPTIVDDRDQSRAGCQRPAPAIAIEPVKGYVQLVYSLDAGNGRGLWLTHAMGFGDMWHPPVGILFGERASRVSVAAAGDTVAIAYEDPNDVGVISLALSFTAGHVFAVRSRVSGDGVTAVDPRVALDGDRVAVAWRVAPKDAPPDSSTAWTVRVGTLR